MIEIENRIVQASKEKDRPRSLVVRFDYDPEVGLFSNLKGDGRALLKLPCADWRQPGFFLARLHADDRDRVQQACLTCFEEGGCLVTEFRLIGAEEPPVWVRMCAVVAERDGLPCLSGTLTKIEAPGTLARPAIDLPLRRALRRAAADIARPLNEMSRFGRLLERHLAAQRDDVGSDYAVGVRDGIEQMQILLQQFLEHAGCEDSESRDRS